MTPSWGIPYLKAHRYFHQALAQAKNKSRHHKDILDSTKAVLFFGTPHAGLEIGQLVDMVHDMSGVGEPSSRLKLLYHLTSGSEFLLGLRDELTEIWDKLDVFSFYENKKTPTVRKKVSHQLTFNTNVNLRKEELIFYRLLPACGKETDRR